MNIVDEKLVEKIKKLLALGNSTNEYEAKLAAEKASELLTKHNLSMQQVMEDKTYEQRTLDEKTNRIRREDKWIMPLVADFFFVKMLIRSVSSRDKRRINQYVLIGQPVNTAVAAYIFEFLILQYRQLWVDYKKQYNKTEKSREAYYHGLTHGIKMQLELQVKKTEAEAGLMVIRDDPALQKYIKNQFQNLTTNKSQASLYQDQHAAGAGIEAGKSLNLRRGLTESNKTNQTLGLK